MIAALPAIDAVTAALADPPRRLWLAAALGDWPWALELAAASPDLIPILEPRARACIDLRIDRLEAALAAEDTHTARIGLSGLAALAVPDLGDHLLAALAGPPDRLAGAALELISQHWHDRFADPVFALFARLDPHADIPAPYLFGAAASLLLAHDVRVADVEARLTADITLGPQLLAHMLLRRGAAALPLVARGLRSAVPFERLETAALLAAVDAPWSRRELLAVLHAAEDLAATAECRAALRRSADPEARAAADAWDRRHPYTIPDEPPYTDLDIALTNVDPWLAELIDDEAEFLASILPLLRALDRLAN